MAQQDDAKLRSAVSLAVDDQGNFDPQKFQAYAAHQGAKPSSVADFLKGVTAQQQSAATLSADQLKNAQTVSDQYRGRIQSIVDGPEESKLQNWSKEISSEEAAYAKSGGQLGVPPGTITHVYPGDSAAQSFADHFAIGSTLAKEKIDAMTASAKQVTAQTGASKFSAEQNPQNPLFAPTPAGTAIAAQGGATWAQSTASDQTLQTFAAKGDKQAQAILDYRAQQKASGAAQTAGAEAAAKFPWESRLEQMKQQGDPVFAYDQQNKQTVQVSRAEAQQAGYSNIVKVGQSEIDKAKTSAMQLGDAAMNIQAYKLASQRMDELSGSDIATVSRVLGDTGFKAHFLGAELPTDWLNELYRSKGWQDMPETAKDAVVNYLAARPAAISLLRAINPGVRLTESQIATELRNIPDPTTPSDIRDKQFSRLDRNIDQASKTLVKVPGVDLPNEIRNRLSSQSGAEDAVRARIASQQTGQYKNAKGNTMQVGQEAYDTNRRYIGKVIKVYADGSYDVSDK